MSHPCIEALRICLEATFQEGAIGIMKHFFSLRRHMSEIDTSTFSVKEIHSHSQALADARELLIAAVEVCQRSAGQIQNEIKNHELLSGDAKIATDAILDIEDEEEYYDALLVLTCGGSITFR